MTTIYKSGGIKSTTPVGFRVGSGRFLSTGPWTLTDGTGANFIVTVGKTFYIGYIICSMNPTAVAATLIYDDDGAGRNIKTLLSLMPWVDAGSNAIPVTIECVIPVPSGKYLRISGALGTYNSIFVCGQEI